MKRDELFLRHILPHCFDLNKIAAEAHRLISETVTADRYQQQFY